jgi:hypothetical protein
LNDELVTMQDRLVKTHARMRERLRKENDPAARRAILNEMTEVMVRVQIVGSLLFAKQSLELERKTGAVKGATAKVHKAIDSLKDLRELLDTVSSFLALVDEAIDFAKLAIL